MCWRTSAGNQTKHVARRIFKMREMRCGGKVHRHHCDGEINPADMLTKPLQRQKLERFASYAMNTSFSKTVDAFVEYTGELKKSAERSKKSAVRSAMMLSTTHPKLAAFVGMFAKDKIPSDGSEIQAPKAAPDGEVDLPRWLLDAPIKLKRVSYGRFDAATMQAEVSELTPFETSTNVGLNDSTTK